MFTTDPSHRHSMFSAFFGGGGGSYWRAVTVASNRPWFNVTLLSLGSRDDHSETQEGGGAGIFRSMLVGAIEDVLALIEQSSQSFTAVEAVDVMVPQFEGERLGWLMKKVVAVWRPNKEAPEDLDYVVETSDGSLYPMHPSEDWNPKKSELVLVCQLRG